METCIQLPTALAPDTLRQAVAGAASSHPRLFKCMDMAHGISQIGTHRDNLQQREELPILGAPLPPLPKYTFLFFYKSPKCWDTTCLRSPQPESISSHHLKPVLLGLDPAALSWEAGAASI